MLRFCANLTMLFNELAFPDRFAAAARAGFRAVEFKDPFLHEPARLAELLHENALQLVLFNLPPGNRDLGDRGLGCQPLRRSEFRDGVGLAIEYARVLGCGLVNCLSGVAPPGIARGLLHETYVDNLRFASVEMEKHGVRAVIEPVNGIDIPGAFLTRTDQAASILDEVGSGNLGIEYDVYQAQREEGNLAVTLERHMPRIWHMQVADVPSRAEPGTGEINYPYLFQIGRAHV